jgi:hypothetical protein
MTTTIMITKRPAHLAQIALLALATAMGCGSGGGDPAATTPVGASAVASTAVAATTPTEPSPSAASSAHGHDHHGTPYAIGGGTAGTSVVTVTQLGHFVADHEAAFEITVVGITKVQPTAIRAWFGGETQATALSTVSRAEREGDAWHVHIEPMNVLPVGEKLRVQVTIDGKTHVVSADPIYAGAHGGVLAPFTVGTRRGFIELKFDPNTAELELWIANDHAIKRPIYLPADAEVMVSLEAPAHHLRLVLRDRERNEDFNGTPNMRDGKTYYFTFPGDSDEESSWLMDDEIDTPATVTFVIDGEPVVVGPFRLVKEQHRH